LALLPFSDPEVHDLLALVPVEEWDQNWWLVYPDGSLVRGNRGGGVALLTEIHLTRPLGRLLAFLRLSPLVDALDRFVAQRRAGWSWRVPKGPAPRRFP